MKKHTYEYVKQYFEEQECELLEEKYINGRTKMRYKCDCGDMNDITFKKFQRGQRCRKCRNKKIREKLKFTLEYVKQYFEDYDCVLLSEEYINAHQKLGYICSCGDISEISFDSFKLGNRCKK